MASFAVGYRPSALFAQGHIHNFGGACRHILVFRRQSRVDHNLTGGRIEAVPAHDVIPIRVQLFHRRIVAGFGLAGDGRLLAGLVNGTDGDIDHVVVINGNVVEGRGQILFVLCLLSRRLETRPERIPKAGGHLLRSHDTAEGAVGIQRNNAFIGFSGYHIDPSGGIHRQGDRIVHAGGFKNL